MSFSFKFRGEEYQAGDKVEYIFSDEYPVTKTGRIKEITKIVSLVDFDRYEIKIERKIEGYCVIQPINETITPDMLIRNITNENKGFINNDALDAFRYSVENYRNILNTNKLTLSNCDIYSEPNLQVHFNDKKKATTIIKGDKVVVVRTKKGEKYNRRIGFLEAYFELMSGMSKTRKSKYLDNIIKEAK